MQNPLNDLLSEGIIDEILGRLKSGKEADVFRVVYRGQVVAAKVYKDREQRSFKHNASYKEGRKVRNSRTQRAMDKGSRFGRDEAEDAWKSSEATTLHILHGHGVRVPNPVMFYGGVLLMQIVTDADGEIAPRLIDAPIDPAQAGALYRDLRAQITGMLCCDLIHGDLSPYNVLLGAEGPTLIDFPQTISAAHNSQSERFFLRDFDNIFRFLASFDRRIGAHGGDAREIWRAYARRELTPDFVPAPSAYRERPAPPPPQRGPERGMAPPGGDPGGEWRGQRQGPPGPRAQPQGQPRYAPQGPRSQPQQGPRAQPQQGPRAQPQQGGQHAPRSGPPPERSGPRQPQQAGRGPVVVYMKRPGPREPAPQAEGAPASPNPRPPPAASQPEGGEGRRERGRRR
jgi:RIO kinase 1